jgi:hypothetical protein
MLPWLLQGPGPLAIAPDSSLYLADGLGRLVQSDANGNLKGMSDPGSWPGVTGLAVDADGSLWVSDSSQGRLVHIQDPVSGVTLSAARLGGSKTLVDNGPRLIAGPNPAQDHTQISVLPADGVHRARVVALTLLGEAVAVLPVEPQHQRQLLDLDLRHLASGLYFLSYQEDSGAGYKQEKVFKLAVVR